MVAGEGWHPGVVGIVASRLVERWRRPCVVIALDGRAAGAARAAASPPTTSTPGWRACSEHLTRFGGHRMAAGSGAGRRRRRRRSAARWPPTRRRRSRPDDLIPVERVDAVVPGGDLGLDLAEDLERLRPFGMGNPQPTLLVPGGALRARDRHGGGEGALPLHARDRRRREVARRGLPLAAQGRWRPAPGASPRHRPPARAEPLERNGGAARDPARALPDRAGRDRRARRGRSPSGTSSAPCSARPTLRPTATRPRGPASSRTAAARASPESRATSSRAASPCWWRWPTCRAAGPASRRWWRGSPTARWRSSPGRRSKRSPRSPRASTTSSRSTRRPAAIADPLLNSAPRAHLAWGPAEAEFAIAAYRAALDLRPQLAEVYRALRELPRRSGRTATSRPPCAERAAIRARARLRPPARRPHRARPDRARPRRPQLPHPGRRPKRPRALTHLPRSPRRARGNRAGAGTPSCRKPCPPPQPASYSAARGVPGTDSRHVARLVSPPPAVSGGVPDLQEAEMAETGSKTDDRQGWACCRSGERSGPGDRVLHREARLHVDADIAVDENYRWVEVEPARGRHLARHRSSAAERRRPDRDRHQRHPHDGRHRRGPRRAAGARRGHRRRRAAWATPCRRCSSSATRTGTRSSSWRTRSSSELGRLARDDVARRLHHRPGRRDGMGVRVPREPAGWPTR